MSSEESETQRPLITRNRPGLFLMANPCIPAMSPNLYRDLLHASGGSSREAEIAAEVNTRAAHGGGSLTLTRAIGTQCLCSAMIASSSSFSDHVVSTCKNLPSIYLTEFGSHRSSLAQQSSKLRLNCIMATAWILTIRRISRTATGDRRQSRRLQPERTSCSRKVAFKNGPASKRSIRSWPWINAQR